MAHKKIPTYLTGEQRQAMMEIPTDLSDQDLARYYTLTSEELELVNRRRRPTSGYVEYFSTYLPLGGIPMLLICGLPIDLS